MEYSDVTRKKKEEDMFIVYESSVKQVLVKRTGAVSYFAWGLKQTVAGIQCESSHSRLDGSWTLELFPRQNNQHIHVKAINRNSQQNQKKEYQHSTWHLDLYIWHSVEANFANI